MSILRKYTALIFLSALLSFNLYSVEISGVVTKVLKANINKQNNSEFQKICITFILNSKGNTIALVEDYYFCTIARKYKVGNMLDEEIPENIILDVEDIEPELHTRLQTLHHNSFFIIIDY